MIYMDHMIFYHATPKKGLNEIRPFKEVTNEHNGNVSSSHYACLASSPAQAMYWANMLRKKETKWFIYEVRVEFNTLVENCVGGYHFEGVGKLTDAIEVGEHKDMDGELNVFQSVPVVGILCELTFTSKLLS